MTAKRYERVNAMTRLNAPSTIGLSFARMFGLLVREYLDAGESSDNIYIVSVRAFHHARIHLGD